jgi:hypothetical protein
MNIVLDLKNKKITDPPAEHIIVHVINVTDHWVTVAQRIFPSIATGNQTFWQIF